MHTNYLVVRTDGQISRISCYIYINRVCFRINLFQKIKDTFFRPLADNTENWALFSSQSLTIYNK